MIVLVAFRSICESESTLENDTLPSFFVGPHNSPHSLTASRKVERSSFFIFRIIMLSLPSLEHHRVSSRARFRTRPGPADDPTLQRIIPRYKNIRNPY